MTGIQDPLRPGINEAVNTCKKAGVTVRMVTGDNMDTAIAISKEAGIIDRDFKPQDNVYTVMEGKRFREKVPFHLISNESFLISLFIFRWVD